MVSRSLYLDDIPGARPTRHSETKNSYTNHLRQEIFRFAGNPQKRVIDWYVPPKKKVEPIDSLDEQFWRTKPCIIKPPIGDSGRLSSSLILERQNLTKSFINEPSSVLEASGAFSVRSSSVKSGDPYFPHRYANSGFGEQNKYHGSMHWQPQSRSKIQLPRIEDCYFQKWE